MNEKIVQSPRKLQQGVVDMKDEYTRLTADIRTQGIQLTDLQAQSTIIDQALTVGRMGGENDITIGVL